MHSHFSECPGDLVRFGDHCFEALPSESAPIRDNADDCMDKGGLLWYPESSEEINFVWQKFPILEVNVSYHIGAKNYSSAKGFHFLDGSFLPGIPFFTRNLQWIITGTFK